LIFTTSTLFAQTSADSIAINETALNYIEGWYEGNAERMAKSLHPKLAKRAVFADDQFNHQTAEILISRTEKGGGKKTRKSSSKRTSRFWIFRGVCCRESCCNRLDRLFTDGKAERRVVNYKCALGSKRILTRSSG